MKAAGIVGMRVAHGREALRDGRNGSLFSSEPPENWRYQASCAGLDTDLFFTNQLSGQVRRMCAACPVNQECGEFADETGSYGMWGGTYRPFRPTYGRGIGIDEVAVRRAIEGEHVPLRPAERAAVVNHLRALGHSFGEIEDWCGIPKRTAVRVASRESA